jgi:NTF2-like protein (DUF6841)
MKNFALTFACLMMVANPAAAETAGEIEAWYRTYAPLWEQTDVDLDVVERFYAHPGYFAPMNGAVLAPTVEAHKAQFVAAIAGWKQKGWTGSKLLDVKATMLNPSTALIEADWTLFGLNGTPLDGCRVQPYTYLAAKTEDGWKFLSIHPVACKVR